MTQDKLNFIIDIAIDFVQIAIYAAIIVLLTMLIKENEQQGRLIRVEIHELKREIGIQKEEGRLGAEAWLNKGHVHQDDVMIEGGE